MGSSDIWPALLPSPSGVFICYDATRKDTLKGIDLLLSKSTTPFVMRLILIVAERLSDTDTSAVMLACKSDPNAIIEIDAKFGDALGEPYGIGLIEVSKTTSSGKNKMLNGLRWLLYKLEQKQRRLPPQSIS